MMSIISAQHAWLHHTCAPWSRIWYNYFAMRMKSPLRARYVEWPFIDYILWSLFELPTKQLAIISLTDHEDNIACRQKGSCSHKSNFLIWSLRDIGYYTTISPYASVPCSIRSWVGVCNIYRGPIVSKSRKVAITRFYVINKRYANTNLLTMHADFIALVERVPVFRYILEFKVINVTVNDQNRIFDYMTTAAQKKQRWSFWHTLL